MKILSALLENCNIVKTTGPLEICITGIAYDSRNVEKGDAFFALGGIHTDGRKYISDALNNGAKAVFTDKESDLNTAAFGTDTALIIVENTRNAMSAFSSAFYGSPSDILKTAGVTGTDGKSSTVSFIYQLLNLAGKKAGFISTVNFDSNGSIEKNPFRQSTPESPEIMSILSDMVKSGFEYAALEATSHGLSEKTARLKDIAFNAGVLTNISHEHLEFHGTMDNYVNDKANLFRKAGDFCVLNLNEPRAEYFRKASSVPVYTYGIENPKADISAFNIISENNKSYFDLVYNDYKIKCALSVPGIFNIENIMAALLTVNKLAGIDIRELAELTDFIKPVSGRMDSVDAGQPFTVIVDYAHTPGAFSKLIPAIRKTTEKRLITVFGSAGERDTAKRKIQGEIAGKYSDIIILTDEDPRGEDSLIIIDEIAEGINPGFSRDNIYKIPDRMSAIKKAVDISLPGDTVILLGKGHESSIIYADKAVSWDEKSAALKALKRAGYAKKQSAVKN